MYPKLYSYFSDPADYKQHYIGTLTHCISGTVKRVINGSYTLELETTATEQCREHLLSDNIILAKPSYKKNAQFFIINKTERTANHTIKVYAKHISQLLFQLVSEGDYSATSTVHSYSGNSAGAYYNYLFSSGYITETTPFSFIDSTSDGTTKTISAGLNSATTLGDIFSATGGILEVFGGELDYDNFTLRLMNNIGLRRNIKLKYGSNISNSSQIETTESLYSHILPYGTVENTDTNKSINFYAEPIEIIDNEAIVKRVYKLDCSTFLKDYTVTNNSSSYLAVKTALRQYAIKYAAENDIGKRDVSISIDVRCALEEMRDIDLGDTVDVILSQFGTTATAKITETDYEFINDRWKQLTLGKTRVSVADIILNKGRYLSEKKGAF